MSPSPRRGVALGLMTLCLLVAAALRLPALTAVPPGVHFDEAANAILAAEIAFDGARPLFITSYTGKEILFFYLAAGLMRLVGPGVFALRLTAAFVGLLTVAAAYRLGRELLPDRRVALLAASLLSVSFWHLLFSRLGFRAVSQPLLQALAVAILFAVQRHAVRRDVDGRRTMFLAAAGGLALGLAAYTYLAVRLFPLLLGLSLLPLLIRRDTNRRHTWRLLAVYLAAAGLVAAPLLLFFIQNPAAFWTRIDQVAPDNPVAIAGAYRQALGMLFLEGDPYWRFNLPGRPILSISTGSAQSLSNGPLFNLFWGALLLMGWLETAVRAIRASAPRQRAAALLLALAPLVMLLPTALAIGDILPSNLRAIGLIPFIFYLPALGLIRLLDWAAALLRRPAIRAAVPTAALLILAIGGWATGRAYFADWAGRSDVFYETEADLTAVADYLDTLPPDLPVYLAVPHYRHPTIALLSERYDDVQWLPGGRALVLPPGGPAVVVYTHATPAPDWAAPLLAGATRTDGPTGPDGRPTFVAYTFDSPPSPAPSVERAANFGDVVRLLGYDFAGGTAGETLPLTLYWEIIARPAGPVTPFVHLEDAWGTRWSQVEPFDYPFEHWGAGETVVQRVNVSIPSGAPPGLYRLRLGWFDRATNEQLPHLDGDGRFAGSSIVIENAPVAAGPPPEHFSWPPVSLNQTVLPELRLLGYGRGATTAVSGEPVPLSLWWLADAPLPALLSRIELMRSNGTGLILLDTQPVHDTYPFAVWQTPQYLIDHVRPTLPADLPPGDYRLRLRLLDAESQTVTTADLGPLTVEASKRLFDAPPPEYSLQATFGGEIALQGYWLTEEGDEPFDTLRTRRLSLMLVWRALQRPSDDYTVFVHLLHPDGRCDPCVWQQDTMPADGAYPTSRWIADEMVFDGYTIELPPDLPPGDYPLEIGLYLAENGRRLRVTGPGQPPGDAVVVQPPELKLAE